MILVGLQGADAYADVAAGMAEGIAWLRAADAGVPDGRHEIDGERIFALVSSYDTGPGVEKRFETHRRYLDLQYLLSGTERILYLPAAGMEVEAPYDDAKDIMFYAEPKFSSSLLLRSGELAVFFPDDAHKPGCMAGGRDPVRKVVVKVRV